MFISNLTTYLEPHKYDSILMREFYKYIIDEKTAEQIKNLGVINRRFARPLTDYRPENKSFHINDVHENHLLIVGKQCLNSSSLEVDNLIVASEIADYQTPGLAPILSHSLLYSKFSPAFNLQGTACSSMPRCIELAKHLPGNTLCLIDGITSDIYQTELQKLPEEKVKQKSQEWIKLMFGMLFGDATAAFIISKSGDAPTNNYEVLRQQHVLNLGVDDYKKAAVKRGNNFEVYADSCILDRAIAYTDVVLTKMGIESFGHYERIILHTGSQKIIDAYQDYYGFTSQQLSGSRHVLSEYGNTTGCSLPLVLKEKEFKGKALMIGITMGFGVDIVEIET